MRIGKTWIYLNAGWGFPGRQGWGELQTDQEFPGYPWDISMWDINRYKLIQDDTRTFRHQDGILRGHASC